MWHKVRQTTWLAVFAVAATGCGQSGTTPEPAPAAPQQTSAAPAPEPASAPTSAPAAVPTSAPAAPTSAPANVPAAGPDLSGQTITLGVAAPFTGDVAQFGVSIRRGAEMKVAEVNAAGGVNGAQVELVFGNDAGNPQEAAIVARRLAGNDDIVAVIGHFNSSCSLAGKPIYKSAGVVQFSPASTNPGVTKGSEWTFRNIYDDNFQGYSLAHYVHDKLHLQSVGVFYDNDDYGIGLKEAFIAEAKVLGITIVGQESFERDTVDFTPQLAQIGGAKPDAIIIAGLYTQAAQIAAQARRSGITVPLLGADGLHSIDLIRIGGEATEGMLITVPFLFELGGPKTKGFVEQHRARFEEDPDSWSALTYDAVGTVLQAISTAGTDRRAVRDALAAMSSPETGYDGVTGITYFDAEGDTTKPVHVATVKNGDFVPADLQLLD